MYSYCTYLFITIIIKARIFLLGRVSKTFFSLSLLLESTKYNSQYEKKEEEYSTKSYGKNGKRNLELFSSLYCKESRTELTESILVHRSIGFAYKAAYTRYMCILPDPLSIGTLDL